MSHGGSVSRSGGTVVVVIIVSIWVPRLEDRRNELCHRGSASRTRGFGTPDGTSGVAAVGGEVGARVLSTVIFEATTDEKEDEAYEERCSNCFCISESRAGNG